MNAFILLLCEDMAAECCPEVNLLSRFQSMCLSMKKVVCDAVCESPICLPETMEVCCE